MPTLREHIDLALKLKFPFEVAVLCNYFIAALYEPEKADVDQLKPEELELVRKALTCLGRLELLPPKYREPVPCDPKTEKIARACWKVASEMYLRD